VGVGCAGVGGLQRADLPLQLLRGKVGQDLHMSSALTRR
jgi:hypothetical protein